MRRALIALVFAVLSMAPTVAHAAEPVLHLPYIRYDYRNWITEAELHQAMTALGYDPAVAMADTLCIPDTSVPEAGVRYSICTQYLPIVDGQPRAVVYWYSDYSNRVQASVIQ